MLFYIFNAKSNFIFIYLDCVFYTGEYKTKRKYKIYKNNVKKINSIWNDMIYYYEILYKNQISHFDIKIENVYDKTIVVYPKKYINNKIKKYIEILMDTN